MRQLDEGGGYREQIAKEVEQRLGRLEGDGLNRRPDELEATAKAGALQTALQTTVNACPSCETSNDADAKFCKNCGARL
jgi:hypothetical protein